MFWASAGKSNTDFRASEMGWNLVLGELKDVAHPGMLFGRQTPASTEKVDFSKKTKTESQKKQTTQQEESPDKNKEKQGEKKQVLKWLHFVFLLFFWLRCSNLRFCFCFL